MKVEQKEDAPINCKVVLDIVSRGSAVFLKASPPENGGAVLTSALAKKALNEKKVIFGIKEDVINAFDEAPIYNRDILVAEAKLPVNGEHGHLIYHVEKEISIKPKEQEDGTVDYKELGLIQQVEEGEVLVEKVLATPGEAGKNVYGAVLAAQRGKDAIMPLGRNTKIVDEGRKLIAMKSGHAEFRGGKVHVFDIFNINGDVCNATGNINFNGNVSISGGVNAGFVVKATGDITIRKASEAATIISGGNVTISEGMNGGEIIADGDVKSKYLQNCEVTSYSNVYADAIINCNIKSGASVILVGGKSRIMGGSCSATKSVEAQTIGSENTYSTTNVEVGLDQIAQTRMQEIPIELEKSKELLASVERAVNVLSQLEAAGRLEPERVKQLEDLRYTRENEYLKISELEAEIESLKEKSKHVGYGYIIARKSIYPGVRVGIGNFQMTIKDPTGRAKLTRGEDGIDINPVFY